MHLCPCYALQAQQATLFIYQYVFTAPPHHLVKIDIAIAFV